MPFEDGAMRFEDGAMPFEDGAMPFEAASKRSGAGSMGIAEVLRQASQQAGFRRTIGNAKVPSTVPVQRQILDLLPGDEHARAMAIRVGS